MKHVLTISSLFSLLSTVGFSQNLVPNGSFEDNSGCPTGWSVDYDDQLDKCMHWYNPTQASPDYFNACGNNSVSVPSNHNAYQEAASGEAYIGLYTYSQTHQWNEYIAIQIPELEENSAYLVSFQVNLADKSRFATDGFGMYFSRDTAGVSHYATQGPLQVKPQVSFSDEGVILDKNEWVTLSKVFYPGDKYNNIIIGAFPENGEFQTVEFQDGSKSGAFYFIDNVIIERIPEF